MVDTVQHFITAKRIPLIPASNQPHKDSKRREKRKSKDRFAKAAITNDGQKESAISIQATSNQEASLSSSGEQRKRIDIII